MLNTDRIARHSWNRRFDIVFPRLFTVLPFWMTLEALVDPRGRFGFPSSGQRSSGSVAPVPLTVKRAETDDRSDTPYD